MELNKNDHYPKTKLPVEIILLIIEHLIPDTAGLKPILPASSIITKTLLALTTASRATHLTASRLLWQNCLYIDSSERVRAFRKAVSRKSFMTSCTPCVAYAPTRMLLCPFSFSDDIVGSEYSTVADEAFSTPQVYTTPDGETLPVALETSGDDNEESPRNRPNAPGGPWIMPDTPMYSDPQSFSIYSEIQNLSMAEDVRDILFALAPVLKTLVVDMPLRTLYREDDHYGIRKILREGFETLSNIEEIVSVRDELYLDSTGDYDDPQVWAQWPKLKRMALYNVLAEEELWQNMLLCPQLETAIFTRADGVRYSQNVKREWFKAWVVGTSKAATTNGNEEQYSGPGITIAFCDVARELPDFGSYDSSWQTMDPENKICILNVPTDSVYLQQTRRDNRWGEDPIWVSQEWVRERSLTGTLWEDIKSESRFMSSMSEEET
ncbi:hypothetical protein ACHAP7_008826 [Fusarium lateritium]